MKIQSLLLITWGMLFSTATLYAQTYAFERVTDIHPSGNSEPAYMTVFDDKLYFNAGDGSDGYELWVSDGTAAGTQILKDISPGALDGDPEDFIEYKGKLYFTAQDGTLGRELWVTDGTPEQTHYVVDIHPSAGSSPFHFTLFKDKLFFTATDGAHGREVWMSDGTSANTMLLKDINPGAGNSSSSRSSDKAYFRVYDDKLYFAADDGTTGTELWVSDGTEAGTVLLKDINPSGSSDPKEFTLYNGKLYFSADDGTNGHELWETDGTEAGTKMTANIIPVIGIGSHPKNLIVYNGKLLFGILGKALFASDGTEAGTREIKVINSTSGYTAVPNSIEHFYAFDGKLYFTATGDAYGSEPWVTDGTEAGTHILKDVSSSGSSTPYGYFEYDGKLYFVASTQPNGRAIWISDGTEAGTVKLEPEVATHFTNQVSAPYFTIFHDALYFNARFDDAGEELWKLSPVPASVSELGENKVLVYPNPSSDKVSIEAERRIESLVLYSLAGKRMKALSLSARKAEISLSGLPAGIYFAEVVTSKRKFVRKLIKR